MDILELAQRLKPIVLGWLEQAVVAVAPGLHALDPGSGPHTGTLTLTYLDQGGADVGEAPVWDGAAWTPTDVVTAAEFDHGGLAGLGDDDHTQYLLADGTRALTAAWDAGDWQIRALTFYADVATGTPPLTVVSTTLVGNLNADLLDGYHAADLALVGHTHDHGTLTGLADDDHTQYLLASGARPLTAHWDAGNYQIRARTFYADVPTGTPPFEVDSTTLVLDLNADLLDGNHASAFATAGHTHDHGALTGLGDDDHGAVYPGLAQAETITGLWTFDRDPNPPFAVAAGSAVVPNLDADKLDGYHAADLALAGHTHDHGTLTGLGDDDHGAVYPGLAQAETITGLWTFDRDPNPPFAVTAGSAKVTNLDADLLDGLNASSNPGAAAAIVATNASGYVQLAGLGIGGAPSPTAHLGIARHYYFTAGSYLYIDNPIELGNSYTRWLIGGYYWDNDASEWIAAVGGLAYDRVAIIGLNGGIIAFITDQANRSADPNLTHAEFMALEKMRLTAGGDLGIGVSPSTRLDIGSGAFEFEEMTAPAAGAANTARLYARDDGSGSTQLCVKFSDGVEHVLATLGSAEIGRVADFGSTSLAVSTSAAMVFGDLYYATSVFPSGLATFRVTATATGGGTIYIELYDATSSSVLATLSTAGALQHLSTSVTLTNAHYYRIRARGSISMGDCWVGAYIEW